MINKGEVNKSDLKKVLTSNTFNRHFVDVEKLLDLSSVSDVLGNSEEGMGIFDKGILISILDSLPYGIQIVDLSGEILYVNPKFLSILGIKKEDRIGRSIFDVSKDGSISSVLNTGKAVTNLMNYPKDTTVTLISSATPIMFNNNIIGVVAIVNDVKDVKQLYEQITEGNKIITNLSEKISFLSKPTHNVEDIIGSSREISSIREMVKLASNNESTVLILGETGTGKQLVAESIHNASLRSNHPFVSVNCSAIPENLLESELFGFEKGAFTGAFKTKIGKFELANGGTLFLDEIGDMDIKLQSKILKAIEEKQIQRVGGNVAISLSIRVIAATNRELKDMVKQGLFRQDLYYRLNVFTIDIPPLRARKDDIKDLCEYMVIKLSRKIGKKGIGISQKALTALKDYSWPGNVRELENTLERSIININNWSEIDNCDLNIIMNDENCRRKIDEDESKVDSLSIQEEEYKYDLKDLERKTITEALERFGVTYAGKIAAANALGISIATLYNKIREYKIIEGA